MSATEAPRRPGRVKKLAVDDEIAEVLRFLNADQVAARLGVSPRAVRKWANTDPGFPQPSHREGNARLWKEYDVDRWIADQRIGNRAVPRGWL